MKNKIILMLAMMIVSMSYDSSAIENIEGFSSSIVEQWKNEIKQAFDSAEKEVYTINPKPVTPNDTNPDPAKCICKGTGIITQGDGHTTQCPYHSKSSSENVQIQEKQEKRLTCRCETRCACKTCRCTKMEIK